MSIALVAHAAAPDVFIATTATTPAIDTAGANLIIISCGWQGATPCVPTDSFGNTWTPLNKYTFVNTNTQFFYCINPTVGPGHVFTLTNGIAFAFPVIAVEAFSGAAAFDVQNGATGGPATQPVPTGPVTPTQNNEVIVSSQISINSATASVNSGLSITDFVGRAGGGLGIGMAYKVQGTLATINPIWTGPGVAIQVVNVATFTAAIPPPPTPVVQVTISSAGSVAGGTVTLPVSIASTGGLQCADLIFTLGFNPSDLTLLGAAPGSVSTAAGKTVTLSGNRIVIEGFNQNVIADGILCTLVFTIAAAPSTNSLPISLSGITASDPSANPLATSGIPGLISLAGGTPCTTLPRGLTLNPFTGQITGTPSQAGTCCITYRVTDSLGQTATETCCITITPGLLLYVLNYRELDSASQIATAMPIHTSFTGRLIATDHTRKWTRWNIPAVGGALMYREPGKLQPVFWFGGNAYTLDADKLTDDDLGLIVPYYTTYFFVTHDQEGALSYVDATGQRQPLGTGRKLLAYLTWYCAGVGHIKVTPFVDQLNNPWALVGVRQLSATPKFDLEWGGGQAQGDRIALQFASSPVTGTDNSFSLQRLTAFIKRAQRLQVRGSN